jgi:dipeptidyl aminopeptidase/acylaminoacyl peptidase
VDIRPSENLVAEGIPPVPSALASAARRYTEYRAASFADWHPQRREMLIATRFGNTTQIHRVSTPGGARHQLTFESEPVTGALWEPQDGRFFLFLRDTGGDEFTHIFRCAPSTGAVTQLTPSQRAQDSGILWSHRGDRFAYDSTRRNGADRDIYVMEPGQPNSDRLLVQNSGGGWRVADWSPDDRRLLLIERLSISDSRLWLADVVGGRKTLLTPPGTETVAYAQAKFRRDGRALYVITDRGREFFGLAEFDVETRQLTPLTPDLNWDVEDFDLSPDGKQLALVGNEAGVSRLYLFDTATRQRRPVPAVPAGVIGGLRWHPGRSELAFTLAEARSPGDVYSVDAATGALTRWTESELGGLVADELSRPSLVHWKSFDGRQISGFLYEPPARFAGRRPVIVSIHGGPESQSRPRFLARDNYYLNELGVAVILPNVRGSTGFGKSFHQLDNGLRREDAVKDIGALLDWIAPQPRLDAARVMITGGSYGGYMTLATAVHYSARIRCAVDVVGISNFHTFLKNTESYRRDLRRVEYGDERDPQMRDFFERTAPLNNAAKITKPLLVVQGGNDPRVPASESEQMVAKLRAAGVPVWYLLAKDEGHGFRKKANADFQFYATVLFAQRCLLGEGPLQTPAKAYFTVRERIVFEVQVPEALKLYQAIHGRGPQTHAEFMKEIVEANQIRLPQLQDGMRYVYDPKTETLLVERPRP